MSIKKVLFTNYDSYLHPECNNNKFLEPEEIHTNLSKETIWVGYQEQYSMGNGYTRYKWIPITDAKKLLEKL